MPTSSKRTRQGTGKDESARLRHERRTISCFDTNIIVSKVRLVSTSDSDFTGYAAAKEPEILTNCLVFCLELSNGSYSWKIWRTLGQILRIKQQLTQTHGDGVTDDLNLPEKRTISDDASHSQVEVDEIVKGCQKCVYQWLTGVLHSPIANDIALRMFLGMDPYVELSAELAALSGSTHQRVTTSSNAIVSDSQSKYSKDGFWKGSCLEDFEFLGETEEQRNLYMDCSYSHNFKVRGLTYKTDKRKVDAGSPICKMILLEMFEAQPEDGGRIDHIACRGIVKERIAVINSLPGNPFVLVLNIQIPGDPPVSLVSYFAIPTDLSEKMTSPEDQKFMKLLNQFIDMPRNEKDRLAAWGIDLSDIPADQTTLSPSGLPTSGGSSNGNGRPLSVRSGYSGAGEDSNEDTFSSSDQCHGEARDLGDPGDDTDGEPEHTPLKRKGLGLKIPSLRKMISGRKSKGDTEELGHGRTPSKDDGIHAKLQIVNSGTGEIDVSPKRKGLLSRSLHKISSFRGFSTHIPNPNKAKSSGQDESKVLEDGIAGARIVNPSRRMSKYQELGLAEDEKNNSIETASTTSARETVHSASSRTGTDTMTGGSGGLSISNPATLKKLNNNPKGPMGLPSDISWPTPDELGAFPSDDFRNLRFKLIPVVTEGPWVVKMAVRSTPVLLGQKVVQRYFRGENYMEIDVHVGSSIIAAQIVGVCRSYTKSFASNLGIVIQGDDEDELPERLLACITFNKLDLDIRSKL